jgi:hypothetical protein
MVFGKLWVQVHTWFGLLACQEHQNVLEGLLYMYLRIGGWGVDLYTSCMLRKKDHP